MERYWCFKICNLQIGYIKNCMSAELRTLVGLGFPPKLYTQNANECNNSVLKKGKETNNMTLKEVVQSIRSVARSQEEQASLSLIGSEEWKLLPHYQSLF